MTIIPFTPSSTTNPPFSVVVILDGTSYTLAVMWNIYRQGWYMSLTDQSGNILINQPLIESPPDSNIYLAPGMFTASTLVFRESTQQFEVGP